MKFLPWLTLALILAAVTPAYAAPLFSARVVKVVDGDSLVVEYDGQKIKLRLWGIDAPEVRQVYGKQAKVWLAAMVKGRRVEALGKDIDAYHRLVALVWVDGQSVNEEMVRQGAAWVYDHYCHEAVCDDWRRFQEDARQSGRGLWNNEKAIPPWRWRAATRP